MQRFLYVAAGIARVCRSSCGAATTAVAPAIDWHGWSDDDFEQARAEKRFVLLDLEAVWCHWMPRDDETTYQDQRVRQLIGQQYIAVRVDQDADPALAARYQDYGCLRRWYSPPTARRCQASRLPVTRGDGVAACAIIKDPSPGLRSWPRRKCSPQARPFSIRWRARRSWQLF